MIQIFLFNKNIAIQMDNEKNKLAKNHHFNGKLFKY